MSVYLHVCMCTVYVVPVEVRGGCWVLGTAATDTVSCVMGMELGLAQAAQVLLAAESSF